MRTLCPVKFVCKFCAFKCRWRKDVSSPHQIKTQTPLDLFWQNFVLEVLTKIYGGLVCRYVGLLLCVILSAIKTVRLFLFDRETSNEICWSFQISSNIRLINSALLKGINGIVYAERIWQKTPKYFGNGKKSFSAFRRVLIVVKSAFFIFHTEFILKCRETENFRLMLFKICYCWTILTYIVEHYYSQFPFPVAQQEFLFLRANLQRGPFVPMRYVVTINETVINKHGLK